MVGVITGPGLLGSESFQHGIGSEKSSNGQTLGGDSYVNLSNGRLILQYVDESLSGSSGDLNYIRYTGGSANVDANGDGWSDGVRRVDSSLNLSTNPSLGSSFTWYMRDGSAVEAVWNGSIYVIEDGAGAHDTVEYDTANNRLIWTNGDSGFKEYVSFGDSPYTKGRILSSRDTEGNGRDYGYAQISTGAFRLTQITDVGNNQKLVLEYDNYGRLEYLKSNRYSSASSEVIETQYIYNSSTDNRLKEVRSFLEQADGTGAYYSTQYEYYNSTNLVNKVTQSDGTEISIGYESYSNNGATDYRVTSVTDRWGSTGFIYGTNTVLVTRGDGSMTVHTFENNGRRHIISHGVVDGYEQKQIFNYDASGNLIEIEDGDQNKVKRNYDDNGNLTHEWVQKFGDQGTVTVWRYSNDNLLQSKTVYKDTYTYTDYGNAEPPSSYEGNTSYFVYDNERNLRYTVSAEGRVTRTNYVNASSGKGKVHQQVQYVDARYANVANLANNAVLSESDLSAWLSTLSGAEKSAVELTEYVYNNLDQLITTRQYANVSTSSAGVVNDAYVQTHFVYNNYGQLIETYTQQRYTINASPAIQESYTYDGLGRVKTATKAGVSSTYTYDISAGGAYGAGAVSRLDVETGLTTMEVFDLRGRMSYTQVSPAGDPSATRYAFYSYDDAGRLFKTSKSVNGQEIANYTYYNRAGQVSFEVSASGGVISYKYDANGQLEEKLEYATGLSASEMSSLTKDSNLSSIMAGKVNAEKDLLTDYQYNADGSLNVTFERYNGQWTQKMFVDLEHNNDVDWTITYSNATNEASRFVKNYYDKDGLLIGQTNQGRYLTEYVYDGAGRLSKTIRYEQTTASAAYNATFDQLKAMANVDVSGDGDGNRITYFYYDAQGRQVGTINEQGFFTETEYLTSRFQKVQHQYHDVLDFIGNLNLDTASFSDIKAAMAGRDRYTTTETYDRYGRLYSTSEASGLTTQYLYDEAGRLAKTIEHITTTTNPDLGTVELPFDQNGLWDFTENGWQSFQGQWTSGGTGPSGDAGGDGVYAYLEASSGNVYSTGQEAVLESQPFYASANSDLQFKYHMYGSNIGKLAVEVFHDGQWKEAWSLSGQQHSSEAASWSSASVDLGAYEGAIKVRFKGTATSSGYQGDISVDSVVITQASRLGQRVTHTQYNAFSEVTGTVSGEGARSLYEGNVLVESFESFTVDGAANGSGWTTQSTTAAGTAASNTYWRVEEGETNSPSTGPSGGGSQGARFAYFETSGGYANTYKDTGSLISPSFTLQNSGGRLEFDYHMYGSQIGDLYVEVEHNGQWQKLWTISGGQHSSHGDEWSRQSVDLSAFEGQNTRIRFRAEAKYGGGYYGDIAIDNVRILDGQPQWAITQNPSDTELQRNIDAFGVRYEYDQLGRQLVRYDAEGQKTWFFYDQANRLTHTVNAEREVSETVYDARGRVVETRKYNTLVTQSVLDQALAGRNAANTPLISGGNALTKNASLDEITAFEYDARGQLTHTTDAEGNQVVNEYNGYGDVLSKTHQNVSDPNNIRVDLVNTFKRDTLGRAIETAIRKQNGSEVLTSSQGFDGYGALIRSTDGLGQSTTYRYGWNGRLVETFNHNGDRFDYSYRGALNHTSTMDGEGHYTHHYDSADGSTRIVRPDDSTIVTKRNEDGQVLAVTDGRGNTTRHEYDLNGNLRSVFDALGNRVQHNAYDESGRVIKIMDAKGTITEITYDHANRKVSELIDPNGLKIQNSYIYDNLGRLLYEIKGSARVKMFGYNQDGSLNAILTDPFGLQLITTYEYDSLGNTTKVTRGDNADPYQAVTEYEFDEWGRKSKEIIDPDGLALTTQYFYDNAGNLTRVIDANGNSTWNIYDDLNQLVYKIDAEHQVMAYSYDGNGRRIEERRSATPLVLYSSELSLNSAGEVTGHHHGAIAEVNYSDQITKIVLDNMGREVYTVAKVASDKWIVHQNIFDENSNIIETRRYDNYLTDAQAAGELSTTNLANAGFNSVSAKTQVAYLAYDVNDRLAFTVEDGYVVKQEFNARGELITKTKLKARYTNSDMSFEALDNWATSGRLAQGQNERFIYDSAGRQVYKIDAMGHVTKRELDSLGRVVNSIRYAELWNSGSTSIEAMDGQYDGSEDFIAWGFEYDHAGRVVREISPELQAVDRQSTGQTSTTQSRSIVTEYSYDDLGRVVLQQAGILAYDSNGSLQLDYSEARTSRSVYDKAGNKTYSIDALDHVVKFEYDGLGQIIKSTEFAGTPQLSNGPLGKSHLDNITASLSSSEDRVAEFVYDGLGREVYVINNSRTLTKTNYNSLGQVETSLTYDLVVGNTGVQAGQQRDIGALDSLTALNILIDSTTRGEGFNYDNLGRLVTKYDAKGYSERYTYDAFGNVQTVQDKNGNVVTYLYDNLNRITAQVSPIVNIADSASAAEQALHIITETHYDEFGNVEQIVEGVTATSISAANNEGQRDYGKAVTTDYEYDKLNRQIVTKHAGYYDANTGRFYKENAAGRVRKTTYTDYDNFGNIAASHDQLGGSVFTSQLKAYDKLGRVVHEIDQRGVAKSYQYNAFGENTKIIQYANSVDANRLGVPSAATNGTIISREDIEDELNQIKNSVVDRTIETIYNNAGQKVKVLMDAVSHYNNLGGTNSKPTINDLGGSQLRPETQYRYNAFGELASEHVRVGENSNPDSSDWNITYHYYDKLGQERFKVDALGYVTEKRYDNVGNTEFVIEYANPLSNTPTYSSASDSLSQLPSVGNLNKDRILRFEYNDLNQQTAVYRLNHSYSEWNGSFTQQTVSRYGDGELLFTNTYDAAGNVKSVTDDLNNVITHEYNALGDIEKRIDPARIAPKLEASEVNLGAMNPFLNQISVTPEVSYKYDVFGNILQETHGASGEAGKITTIDRQYDALGNEISTKNNDLNAGEVLREFDINGRVREERQVFSASYVDRQALPEEKSITNDNIGPRIRFQSSYANDPNWQAVSFTIWDNARDTFNRTQHSYTFYYEKSDANIIGLDFIDPDFSINPSAPVPAGQIYASGGKVKINYADPYVENTVDLYDEPQETRRTFHYDAAGNQIATLDVYENASGQMVRSGTKTELNSFGEVAVQYAVHDSNASSGYEGVKDSDFSEQYIQERTVFDKAGRIIEKQNKTGVSKYYSDLSGQVTIQIQQGDSGASDDRITEWVRDIKGSVVEERQPEFSDVINHSDAVILEKLGTDVFSLEPNTETGQTDAYNITVDILGAPQNFTFYYDSSVHSDLSIVNANASYLAQSGQGYSGSQIFSSNATSDKTAVFQLLGHNLYYNPEEFNIADFSFSYPPYGQTTNLRSDVAGERGVIEDIVKQKFKSSNNVTLDSDEVSLGFFTPMDNQPNPPTPYWLYYKNDGQFQNVSMSLFNNGGMAIELGNADPYDFISLTFTYPSLSSAEQLISDLRVDISGDTYTQNLRENILNNTKLQSKEIFSPTIERTFDRWGNVLSYTDTAGHLTAFEYDHNNQLIKETTEVEAIDYQSSSHSEGAKRVVSREKYHYYDQQGHNIGEASYVEGSSEALRVRRREYDNVGQLTKEVDATDDRNETWYAYDIFGNKVAEKNGVGTIFSYDYDNRGNLLNSYILRKGTNAQNSYVNADGALSDIHRVRLSEYAYDQAGNRFMERNFAGASDGAGVRNLYFYDARGNIVKTVNPSNLETSYEYDAFGNKSKESGSGGVVREWLYNKADFETSLLGESKTSFNGALKQQSQFEYTNFGQLESEDRIRFNGQVLASQAGEPERQYFYLENGLLGLTVDNYYSETYSDPNDPRFNQVTLMESLSGKKAQNLRYDVRGLQIFESTFENSTHSRFGTFVNFTSGIPNWQSYSNADTDYSQENYHIYSKYDSLGQLSEVRAPKGNSDRASINYVRYVYDALGNRVNVNSSYVNYHEEGLNYLEKQSGWFTYDGEGRVVIEQGVLNNDTHQVDFNLDSVNDERMYIYDGEDRVVRTISRLDSPSGGDVTKTLSFTNDKFSWTSVPGWIKITASGSDGGDIWYDPTDPQIGGEISSMYAEGVGGAVLLLTFTLSRPYTYFSHKTHQYNDLGFELSQHSVGNSTDWSVLPGGAGNPEWIKTYNDLGRELSYMSGKTNVQNEYGADGRLLRQTSSIFKDNRYWARTNETFYSNFNGDGKAERRTVKFFDDYNQYVYSQQFDTKYSYQSGANRISSETLKYIGNSPGGLTGSTSTNSYDPWGNLTSQYVGGDNGGRKQHFYDFNGRIVRTLQTFTSGADSIESSYFFQGNNLIGHLGSKSENLLPAASQTTSTSRPGNHSVAVGESLASIAQLHFGDSSLWYLIADANNLVRSPGEAFGTQDAGRNLIIPNVSVSVQNTANSFTPYNPGEIMGDFSPTPVQLPPPPPPKCNPVAIIAIVVVAIVVTVATAGAAAAAMGTTMSAGISGATMTAAFIGGFAGSVASQLVGKALGVVESFDLRQAFASGLTNMATFGLGQLAKGAAEASKNLEMANKAYETAKTVNEIQAIMIQATKAQAYLSSFAGMAGQVLNAGGGFVHALANAGATFAAGRITGTVDDNSDAWAGIAASALSSTINPVNQINFGDSGFGQFAQSFLGDFTTSSISANLTRKSGEKIDYGLMAVNAFGSSLGSAIGAKVKEGIEKRVKSSEIAAQKKSKQLTIELDDSALSAKTLQKIEQAEASLEAKGNVQEPDFDSVYEQQAQEQDKKLRAQMKSDEALAEQQQKLWDKLDEFDQREQAHVQAIEESNKRFKEGVNRIAAENRAAKLRDPDSIQSQMAEIERKNEWRKEFVAAEESATEWKNAVSYGALETAATIGSGLVAVPLSGLAMIASGGDVGFGEYVREQLTYTPKTEGGQHVLNVVGEAALVATAPLTWASETLGDAAFELTGNAAVAATFYTAPEAITTILAPGSNTVVKSATRTAGKSVSLATETAGSIVKETVKVSGSVVKEGVKVADSVIKKTSQILSNSANRVSSESLSGGKVVPKSVQSISRRPGADVIDYDGRGATASFGEVELMREVAGNPVSTRSYQQLGDHGVDFSFKYDSDFEDLAVYLPNQRRIEFYPANIEAEALSFGVEPANYAARILSHEAKHVRRDSLGVLTNTKYDEYIARRREVLFERASNPSKYDSIRPSLSERRDIYDNIFFEYPHLPLGQKVFK